MKWLYHILDYSKHSSLGISPCKCSTPIKCIERQYQNWKTFPVYQKGSTEGLGLDVAVQHDGAACGLHDDPPGRIAGRIGVLAHEHVEAEVEDVHQRQHAAPHVHQPEGSLWGRRRGQAQAQELVGRQQAEGRQDTLSPRLPGQAQRAPGRQAQRQARQEEPQHQGRPGPLEEHLDDDGAAVPAPETREGSRLGRHGGELDPTLVFFREIDGEAALFGGKWEGYHIFLAGKYYLKINLLVNFILCTRIKFIWSNFFPSMNPLISPMWTNIQWI